MSFSSHSYAILYVIRMSTVCSRMSLTCHLYFTPMCSYSTFMYLYAIRMSLLCTRMLYVCHSYVLKCHDMSLVCNRMSSVCHSYVLVCHPYVTRMWFYHEPETLATSWSFLVTISQTRIRMRLKRSL